MHKRGSLHLMKRDGKEDPSTFVIREGEKYTHTHARIHTHTHTHKHTHTKLKNSPHNPNPRLIDNRHTSKNAAVAV